MFLADVSPGLEMLAAIIGLGVAVILHEVAHGYAALRLGDPTAYYAGRLSLNPIRHVDLWGTIIIPLLLIVSHAGFVVGWAKPVPVNYYNLRNGRYGPLLVALAGPGMNFILVALFGLLARFSPAGTALPFLFAQIALTNSFLMFFNLVPIPPLDGSKVLYLFLENRPDVIQFLERYGFMILIAIMILGQGILSRLLFGPAVNLTLLFAGR